MAYMPQEKKKLIAANLKKIMPKDWKYSLAVRHHSTIVMTIRSAPIDLMGIINRNTSRDDDHFKLSPYHYENQLWQVGLSDQVIDLFKNIFFTLNEGNHDRSDTMTDYFDVGWYVDVQIGKWDKPFVNTSQDALNKVSQYDKE